MNRRDAMKTAALAAAAIGLSTSTAAAAETTKNRTAMKVQDPAKPTDFEYKHLPQITVGEKDAKGYTVVDVTIGQNGIIHPSEANHWIDFIELYADDKLVGKTELLPVISRGYVSFAVKLDDVKTLKAVEGCNLHGVWESTLTL